MGNCLKFILIIFVFLVIGPTVTAEVYKWKDKNGVLHFSDIPPADIKAEIVEQKPSSQTYRNSSNDDNQELDETLAIEELDLHLRNIWAAMRANLKNNNIDGALEYFYPTVRAQYKKIFLFIEEKVPGGVSGQAEKLPDPILIEIEKDMATYVLPRKEDGNDIEYTLIFVKDHYFTKQWKIYEY